MANEAVMMSTLIKSYEESFDKFGWMFLSLEHANPKKISIYLDSLDHLIVDITYKLEIVQSSDKKEELVIMLYNCNILKEHANRNFHGCFLLKPHSTTSSKKLPHI